MFENVFFSELVTYLFLLCEIALISCVSPWQAGGKKERFNSESKFVITITSKFNFAKTLLAVYCKCSYIFLSFFQILCFFGNI